MSVLMQDPRNGAQDTPAALPRRSFLKIGAAAGGGLMIGFVMPARGQQPDRKERPAETAVGQAAEKATGETGALAKNAFIRIDREGVVTLVMHKVEMGQGTYTSMPMLLAEELEVDITKVKLEQAPPDNERYGDPLLGGQVTGGSTSVRLTINYPMPFLTDFFGSGVDLHGTGVMRCNG